MKARLIKNDSGNIQILYSNGSIGNCTNDNLYNFLSRFKEGDTLYGSDGEWKSSLTQDMSMYPGETLAIITDDYNLLLLDFSPFEELLNSKFGRVDYVSPTEFGKMHNRSAEVVKVYCREGRIPGAKLVGSTWIIPSDASYPLSPAQRKDWVSEMRRSKKNKGK